MVVVWGDPPTDGSGRHTGREYGPLLEKLRERPREWARIIGYAGPDSASKTAVTLRKRFGREFEFIARRVHDIPNCRSGVWARYLGAGIAR